MEGVEIDAQRPTPILLHQSRFHEIGPPPLARKRDSSMWANANYNQHHHLQKHAIRPIPTPTNNSWNCKMWDWDSVAFVAKPSSDASDRDLCRNSSEGGKNQKGLDLDIRPDECLTLKLGGGPYVASEEPNMRPSKRVRSGSPGSGASYPMCQVDECKADLSSAKDYHRRHKVCEVHSKTTKAVVGKQMQRFCQQCSRFHPLSEFDEGKRSCRRRLAGHNRRRRKVQADGASTRMLLSGNQDNNGNGSLDIVNLLSIFARLQGNGLDKLANQPSLPDKDQLAQILGKISNIPDINTKAKPPVTRGFDLNVSQTLEVSEQLSEPSGTPPAPSTMDLMNVFSTSQKSSTPESTTAMSQGSSGCSDDDKVKMNHSERAADVNSHNQVTMAFSPGGGGSNRAVRSSFEVERAVQMTKSAISLQHYSSPESNSPPKVGSSSKYLSSESSNPMEEVSPSSSPPVAQKLFPLHSDTENLKNERMSIFRADTSMIEGSTTGRWDPPDLVKDPERRTKNQVAQNLPYQAGGYTSSSGSDHSPSSSKSDAHNRTGRVTLKLFGKDPSNFPEDIKSQILNWLSHIPTEMESYIRPGCVVLSVYLSMPPTAWDDLQDDLLHRLHMFLQCSSSDFWKGRFLIRTDRVLASHKDGKVRICKSWETWSSPELKYVSPLAVVSGKETSLLLRGRNLNVPGTKIHCTNMGGYTSKEVLCTAYPGTVYDDFSMESFLFPGCTSNIFGRCFIEVENGFKGNSFPIIVANESICQELRLLETELEDMRKEEYAQAQEHGRPLSTRENIIHFLHELGWLFQRNNVEDFSCTRIKFLFIFSVERDWSVLVKKLLDIFSEGRKNEALIHESMEMLAEIQLLNRAVKRKCRKMVDMLLYYSVNYGTTKTFLFLPNHCGPGGVTPLHLAACTQDSKEMVDALTSDPQEIGLNSWNSLLDDNDMSPSAYASVRNYHHYNLLVARKHSDIRSSQVSITIRDEEIALDKSWVVGESDVSVSSKNLDLTAAVPQSSCSRCAIIESRIKKGTIHSQGLLCRPYIHSMLAIAAVCVCVCLILRGAPQLNMIAPFKWENLNFGPQ